jgi:preprotein translocase subunit SecF
MELFPHNSNFNFMRLRGVSLFIAAALMVAAIYFLAAKNLNYALDFTGGTMAEVKFERAADTETLRSKLEAAGVDGAKVQTLGTQSEFAITLQGGDVNSAAQVGQKILNALQTSENPARLVQSSYVGPQIGKELARDGLSALIFVTLGFIIYIWIRFEWKFAVAAIITTLHDVLIVVGWFALFQHEFDLTVLAGVLSVMGYSINDTIVVFDRVRENFKSLHRLSSEEVLNRSINQTISRTIITSFVALLTVVALYLFGGRSLEGMAESQIVGIVLGTLSSIFVACPLLLMLKVNKFDLLPKARDEAALNRRP